MKYDDNANLTLHKLLSTLSSVALKWGEDIFAGIEKHQVFWEKIKLNIVRLTRKVNLNGIPEKCEFIVQHKIVIT